MQLQDKLEKILKNVSDWYSWIYYMPKEEWPIDVLALLPFPYNKFPPHELIPILREVISGMVEWGRTYDYPHGTLINLIQESEELLKQTAPPTV